MPKMKLILVQDPEFAEWLLKTGEPHIRIGNGEFFGPYSLLQLAPVRQRLRAAAGRRGYGATICFIDAEVERIMATEDVVDSS